MQVFRGMDIGTAKPDSAARERFIYHMVDVADPAREFNVAEFQTMGTAILDKADADGGRPIVIAGGSGLHFRSLVDPLEFPGTDPALREELERIPASDLSRELLSVDPDAGAVVDLNNPRRVLRAVEIIRMGGERPTTRAATDRAADVRSYRPIRSFTAIGIDPGPLLTGRIERRFDTMMDTGFLDEVARLAPVLGRTARQAVGYRELLGVVEGTAEPAEARDRAIRATRALAKRQRTYFRKDPRIRWIPWHHDVEQMTHDVISQFEEGSTWTS